MQFFEKCLADSIMIMCAAEHKTWWIWLAIAVFCIKLKIRSMEQEKQNQLNMRMQESGFSTDIVFHQINVC